MNISGFELNRNLELRYCHNAYCSTIVPLCFAGVSSCCNRNRSYAHWHHFSFGEHVCANCVEFLSSVNSKRIHSSDSVWLHRLSAWRREWLRKCSQIGRRHIPTTTQFLAAQFLPWWLKCQKCGKWRQVPPQTPIGSPSCQSWPGLFSCGDVIKKVDDPCTWIVDERATLVCDKPQDFLASMQAHAWLQDAPCLRVLSSYGIDLTGVSPDPLPGANLDEISTDGPFKAFDEFSTFSPIDLNPWERLAFPEMTRFPTLYLAIRNLIICLWFRNPKSLLTPQFVATYCFVRGLLRIVLCEYWIPHLVDELTCRGIINIGFCQWNLSDYRYMHRLFGFNKQKTINSVQVNSKPVFELRVIGSRDLTNLLTLRQIYNAYVIRNLSTLTTPVPLSLKFISSPMSIDSGNGNNQIGNSLLELSIKFMNTSHESIVNLTPSACFASATTSSDKCDNYSPSINVALPSSFTRDLSIDGLSIPLHAWSDRVYMYSTHPISVLAWQTNLARRTVPKCALLFRLTENKTLPADNFSPNQTHLIWISDKQSTRIEFHVEAVLHLVAQMYAKDSISDNYNQLRLLSNVNDETVDSDLCSIEGCWDKMDQELRKRLSDLTNDEIERSLIEFYLAAIEYDLTEPLTTNIGWSNSGYDRKHQTFNTARLDQLPPHVLTETTIDKNLTNWTSGDDLRRNNFSAYLLYNLLTETTIDNNTNKLNNEPHISNINDNDDNDLRLNSKRIVLGASNHLLKMLTKFELDPFEMEEIFTNHNLSAIVVINTVDDQITMINNNIHDLPIKHKSQLLNIHEHNQNLPKNIRLDFMNSAKEFIDWLIITTSIDQLCFYFVDDGIGDYNADDDYLKNLIKNNSHQLSSLLPIFLPSQLYPILCENNLSTHENNFDQFHNSNNTTTNDNLSAYLITVVLVYDTPWWRNCLIDMSVNFEKNQLFSIGDELMRLDDDTNTELFAILPEYRDSRGFCHKFRDIRPDMEKPGILQTHIFAKSADHWWPRSDNEIVCAVDEYLRRYLTVPSNNGMVPHLIGSHVAKLQSRPSSHISKQVQPNYLSMICGYPKNDNIWVRVKPTAWLDLVNLTGILVTDLMNGADNSVYSSTRESDKKLGLTQFNSNELIDSFNPLHSFGMDVLSSAVQSGLKLAELALHLMPRQPIRNSNFGDSGVCPMSDNVQERQTISSQSHISLKQSDDNLVAVVETPQMSERAKRFSKRKRLDVDLS